MFIKKKQRSIEESKEIAKDFYFSISKRDIKSVSKGEYIAGVFVDIFLCFMIPFLALIFGMINPVPISHTIITGIISSILVVIVSHKISFGVAPGCFVTAGIVALVMWCVLKFM